MRLKRKQFYSYLLKIGYFFILLTFIIIIANIPRNTYFNVNFKEMEVITNLSVEKISVKVISYYENLIKGSLGYAYNYKAPIPAWQFIKQGFENTITLLIGSITLSLCLGLMIGFLSSKGVNRVTSPVGGFITSLFSSMPSVFIIFFLQFLAIVLYKNGFKFFPSGGYDTPRHIILPLVSLSLLPTMYISKITAVAVGDIYEEDYIRTALGKGVSKMRLLSVHVLKNVIVEIAGAFTAITTILLSTLLLVEYLFWFPGITLTMLNQISKGEPDVVIAIALVFGLLYLVIDLIFKGVKGILDSKRGEYQ